MTLLEQLQQLAPLAAAATAGPWKQVKFDGFDDNWGVAGQSPLGYERAILCDTDADLSVSETIANAAFITAARNLLTPEKLALLVAALVAASDEAELLRLCSRGIAAARTQAAIIELLDTLKWLMPLVPKSKLDGDALEAIGGARFTGEELVTELRSKVSAIEKQVKEWPAAPKTKKGGAND